MRFEDAGCDHPCGMEPMGCGTCDSAFSDNLVPNLEPGDHFSCNDVDSCEDCHMKNGCENYHANFEEEVV